MFGFKKETGAQLYDRFVQRLALAMFVLAIVYALEASGSFVAHDIAHLMKRAEGILGILVVVFLLPATVKLVWFRVRGKLGIGIRDGFLASQYKDAAAASFAAGFIAMLVAVNLSKTILVDWSASIFLYLILALMLGVLSVSFLIANRETGPDDDFDDDFDDESAGRGE